MENKKLEEFLKNELPKVKTVKDLEELIKQTDNETLTEYVAIITGAFLHTNSTAQLYTDLLLLGTGLVSPEKSDEENEEIIENVSKNLISNVVRLAKEDKNVLEELVSFITLVVLEQSSKEDNTDVRQDKE